MSEVQLCLITLINSIFLRSKVQFLMSNICIYIVIRNSKTENIFDSRHTFVAKRMYSYEK